jgi:hypothetical protein
MEAPHNTSTVIFRLMLLWGFIIIWASGEGCEIAVAGGSVEYNVSEISMHEKTKKM